MCKFFRYCIFHDIDEGDDEETEMLISKAYIYNTFSEKMEAIHKYLTDFSGKVEDEMTVVQEVIKDNNDSLEEEVYYLKKRVTNLEHIIDGFKKVFLFNEV